MAKNRDIEVFGLSFMDLISCGLGGMLVLMFVFSTLVNAQGVAKPSEAQSKSLSPAALQRAEIFNTHFVLKLALAKDTQVNVDDWDIIHSYGIEKDISLGIDNHIFMVLGADKIVKKVTFDIQNNIREGQGKLMGEDSFIIPIGQQSITVVKEKTEYRIQKN